MSNLRAYYVEKAGLGRVTIAMTKEDCLLYIKDAERHGGSGYTVIYDPSMLVGGEV